MYELTRQENGFEVVKDDSQTSIDPFRHCKMALPAPTSLWRRCRPVEKMAWKDFIRSGQVQPGTVPLPIADSWYRCLRAEVEFAGGRCQDILSPHDLKIRQNSLLEVAHPLISGVQKLLQGFGFIIVLIDPDGYILKGTGDLKTLREAEKINFGPGSNWSELSVGTNAIGTALVLGRSIQVTGPEHYNDGHHLWTCAATPIFDPTGKIIGCLDISGPRENSKFPILEMVTTWARVIEDRLHMELAHDDLLRRNQYMNAALETVRKGLVALDQQGIITSVNSVAAKLLDLTPQQLIGRQISATPLGRFVNLVDGQATTEQHLASLKTKSGPCHCLITATPINDDGWPGSGSVITLSEAFSTPAPKASRSGGDTRYTFEDIIGDSEPITETLNQATMTAPNNSTVLILGESGVGKELFAQAIHHASLRRRGPFVSINCAALPKELIQSELFGYVEGAFTGARKGGCRGKLELAHGGTLFLDEIADMPLDLQANLLRVLEEKNFIPLGGERRVEVDFRVIAATNRSLEAEIRAGRFREDLYYRINVVVIKIPPLRERQGDLPLLVGYQLARLAKKMGRPIPKMDPGLITALDTYHWPGNVRELINVLEQGLNYVTGDTIGPDHLPSFIKQIPDIEVKEEERAVLPLSIIEKNAIENALSQLGGNLSRVAKALGIGRNTLYSKMSKYGLSGKEKFPKGFHRGTYE